jgi:hypothetical protein
MWDLHKDYFNQDESTQKIEDWMNIKSIESRFEVDFKNELNIDLSFYDKRKPLSTICIEENLDCKNIIRDLNKKYNLNDNSSGDNKK